MNNQPVESALLSVSTPVTVTGDPVQMNYDMINGSCGQIGEPLTQDQAHHRPTVGTSIALSRQIAPTPGVKPAPVVVAAIETIFDTLSTVP